MAEATTVKSVGDLQMYIKRLNQLSSNALTRAVKITG
jgi:hypothetical protein